MRGFWYKKPIVPDIKCKLWHQTVKDKKQTAWEMNLILAPAVGIEPQIWIFDCLRGWFYLRCLQEGVGKLYVGWFYRWDCFVIRESLSTSKCLSLGLASLGVVGWTNSSANHLWDREQEFEGSVPGLVIDKQGVIHECYLSHVGKSGSLL